jgi:hypothetical protein
LHPPSQGYQLGTVVRLLALGSSFMVHGSSRSSIHPFEPRKCTFKGTVDQKQKSVNFFSIEQCVEVDEKQKQLTALRTAFAYLWVVHITHDGNGSCVPLGWRSCCRPLPPTSSAHALQQGHEDDSSLFRSPLSMRIGRTIRRLVGYVGVLNLLPQNVPRQRFVVVVLPVFSVPPGAAAAGGSRSFVGSGSPFSR